MPRKGNRLTDHDRSTALYVAQIEQTYDCDLEIHLDAQGRHAEARTLGCAVWATWKEGSGEPVSELIARGPVSTASNTHYNKNVRYLLTVGTLRLMERQIQAGEAPFVRPSDG